MNVLDDLLTVEFEARVAAGANGSVRRKLLQRSPELRRLREARRGGALSDPAIRRFVGRMMAEFSSGQRFPHQNALAAIAALFETYHTPLAEEYLLDLARLERPELTDAVAVARECLTLANRRTRDQQRRNQFDSTPVNVDDVAFRPNSAQPRIASSTQATTAYDGAA